MENRCRFALEVVEAVVKEIGAEKVRGVVCRELPFVPSMPLCFSNPVHFCVSAFFAGHVPLTASCRAHDSLLHFNGLPASASALQTGIRLSPFGGFLSAQDSNPVGSTSYLLEQLNK